MASRLKNRSFAQHAGGPHAQNGHAANGQHGAERGRDVASSDAAPTLRIVDLDGACRELAVRGPGLALIVDGDGRAVDVGHVDAPIPYRLRAELDWDDVERGGHEERVAPAGWVS